LCPLIATNPTIPLSMFTHASIAEAHFAEKKWKVEYTRPDYFSARNAVEKDH